MSDWRLMGQEKWLQGATLVWKPYPKWGPDWDHDHCVFCSVEFTNRDDVPDALREPTTTGFVLIAPGTSGRGSPGPSSEAHTTKSDPGYIHGCWPGLASTPPTQLIQSGTCIRVEVPMSHLDRHPLVDPS